MNNVVSVRIDKIKSNQAKVQLSHDLRTMMPDYLRRDDKNKIYLFGKDLNLRSKAVGFTKDDTDIINKAKEIIGTKIDQVKKDIIDDYRSAHNKKPSSLTKDFLSGVITFGVDDATKAQRENELQDNFSLTDEKVNYINSKDKNEMDKRAYIFLKEFCKKYGSKPVYFVRHDDEKTTHYHFITSHHSFNTHKTITSGFKHKDIKKIGSDLQDLIAESFNDLGFKRGKKRGANSKKHLSISKMHQSEQEELVKTNKQLQLQNSTYKQELSDYKDQLQKYIAELKTKRKEIKESDLDIENKKEQYDLISSKQTEARESIKILTKEIKDLKNNKKDITTSYTDLENKLKQKTISLFNDNTSNLLGKTIVNDTSKLKKDIFKTLKELSQIDIKLQTQEKQEQLLNKQDKELTKTKDQLSKANEKLSQAQNLAKNSKILMAEHIKVHNELNTLKNDTKSKDLEIEQLKADIKELEKTYKFDYNTFKINRKSIYQKMKDKKGLKANISIKTGKIKSSKFRSPIKAKIIKENSLEFDDL